MGRDWRKKESSLGGSLGHIFDTGLYSDVAFLVGEEGVRINAHKTILSARSEPLAAMFERWTSAATEEIKMPRNNPAAVKLFLRFLYTDSFFNVAIDDILEVIHLAHMYQVHELLKTCIVQLSNNIDEKNCLQIHKSCELLDKTLSDKALQFFLRNVVPKAKSTDDYLTWDYDIIEKILKDDREYVPEAILFKALLRWRNVDSARNEAFQKLTKLIRFSTISAKDFASEVVTSGVLSNEETMEVFSYIATQSGTKRKKLLVTTAAIGDPTCLKISGSPSVVDNYTFQRMVGYFGGGNFHQFKLAFKDHPGHSKRTGRTGTGTNDIKLYGVKVFNSDGNTDLMAFLQRKRFKINVTLTSDGSGISKVIEKTIPELNELGMRAYFDSPLVVSQSETYYITTKLTPGGKSQSSDAVPFELPKLLWSQPDLDWDGGKVGVDCSERQGSYSFIEELLFSPPGANEASEGCGDCKIS